MATNCRKCGTAIFQQQRGRPRKMCVACSPPQGQKELRAVRDLARTIEPAVATVDEARLSVEGTTLAVLRAHGRVDSPHGQAALVMARQLDGGRGGGVGIAAIAKEHRSALESALAGARGESDVLDGLAQRLA